MHLRLKQIQYEQNHPSYFFVIALTLLPIASLAKKTKSMTRLRHHERSDDNFYYTAAGEANGNVTIYSKNALMESGYIYFKTIKVPYRCKHYEHY